MFSKEIVDKLSKSSWIRAMFELGNQLKQQYGEDNVFDFTLGNPDLEPPEGVISSLKRIINEEEPNVHKYMNNAGYTDVRKKVAEYESRESGMEIPFDNVVMSVGAAGGLNVVLKSLLNPGEEVIVLAPFFSEYRFYTENYQGKLVVVKTSEGTFQPDVKAIYDAITPATKAIIINSPNNPTGVIYSREILKNVAEAIMEREKEFGTEIFVISDEPYVKLVYDGAEVPNVFTIFKNAIIVSSFSKSLSLPGERIGYVVASPKIKDVDVLMNAMIFCTRVLGYVNAPSLFQKVIADNLGQVCGLESYRERRDELMNILQSAGFSCVKPEGAFYIFMKSPFEDDAKFVQEALKYNIILVGGTGFSYPGYVRLAYCVSMKSIKGSRKAFMELGKNLGLIQ